MRTYNIGYTSGVFDLFHIGHLNILKKAKEQCNYLIVGVSTDENVFEYKGKKPIVPFIERLSILESIKYVDKVVPQSNMDKIAAWKNLRFNVIFLGDDWKGSIRWNKYEKEFSSLNVDIVYFEYTKGVSSTIRKEIIKNKE
jgi:glycerol-3-phosphate cytidylyltransferase